MPSSEVLGAVAAYLDPAVSGITYLGAVYTALPKVANEQDLFNLQPAGQGVGAVIYVFIESDQETRIALGGATDGKKMVVYQLGLLCILKSDLETSDAGQAAFNTFRDALKAWIRADRNAGNSTVVFQWGEGTTPGSPDLRFDYPVPKTYTGGVTLYQAVGRVTLEEILNT
jgi:hypothetical protein